MFTLARDLHMTVQNLLGSMEQRELLHWLAFHRIEAAKDSQENVEEDQQEKNDDALVQRLMQLSANMKE